MRLLLDTHVVLWWLDDPNKIADDARNAIAEPANCVFVSPVVAWEIAIKRGNGKLSAPADIQTAIVDAGFTELDIRFGHAWAVESLPDYHRDPFDRMLIAQAIHEGCTLVTRDAEIQRYSVPLIVA